MKNSQEISYRIKETAKEKGITIKQLLEKCDLSINTLSDLAKGKQISYLNFAKIAECLEVSVDYLLGRTDDPTGKYSINGDNNMQAINHGDNSQITVTNEKSQDRTTEELLELIQSLPLIKRAEAVLYLNSMRKGA